MRTYLVVANLTLGGDHLLDILRDRASAGPCRFHILVPASADPTAWSHTNEQDTAAARERLAAAQERFAGLGDDVEVTGEIGDRPVDAVLDVLRREEIDEIILSTLPAGISRWLRIDLISRLQRVIDVPLTHVIAHPESITAS
jgi:nucleotide-binding universal stress UspA family protein